MRAGEEVSLSLSPKVSVGTRTSFCRQPWDSLFSLDLKDGSSFSHMHDRAQLASAQCALDNSIIIMADNNG